MMINNDNTVQYDHSPQATQQQAEKVLEGLKTELANSTDTLYLLVDPVPLLKLSSSPFRDELIARQPTPVTLPHPSLSTADHPWLLALDISNDDDLRLLQHSMTFALAEIHPDKLCQNAGRAVCGWLTSPFDIHTVAKQVGDTAIQKRMDHSLILMRYYDPAVHNLLWPQLKAFQQQRLMGILSCWVFVDGDGQVIIRRHTADVIPHYTCLLGLMPEQTDFILSDIGIINRALRQHRKLAIKASRKSELACAAQVQQALLRTEGHPALSDDAEKENFALQVLQYHSHIDQHPKIDWLLHRDTFADEVPWSQRIKNITREQWQQYARDCDARKHAQPPTEKIS